MKTRMDIAPMTASANTRIETGNVKQPMRICLQTRNIYKLFAIHQKEAFDYEKR